MDNTTSMRDLKKELRELKEKRRKRVTFPYPRAFVVEAFVSFAAIYWGVCFLLTPVLFNFAFYSEFKKYPFSENQIGVFLVVIGILTALASLSRNSLARTSILAVQLFTWIFITNATFHAVPYGPSNSLLIIQIVLVASAFIQVSLRLAPNSNWNEEQEGNW